jgi:hypothetical protein
MLVASVPNIKASDIINTAENLKRKNLSATEVKVNFFEDHISIVDPTDDHMLSYIKRNEKASG